MPPRRFIRQPNIAVVRVKVVDKAGIVCRLDLFFVLFHKPGLFFQQAVEVSVAFPAVQFKLCHNVQVGFPRWQKPLTASPTETVVCCLSASVDYLLFGFAGVFLRGAEVFTQWAEVVHVQLCQRQPRLVPGCARFALYQYNAKFCNVKPASQSVPGSGVCP